MTQWLTLITGFTFYLQFYSFPVHFTFYVDLTHFSFYLKWKRRRRRRRYDRIYKLIWNTSMVDTNRTKVCISILPSLFCWWLVRVTLVVDLWFLPQNFGHVVGTYEGLLVLCECRWGVDHTCRWWGHLTTICCHQTFLTRILNPSIGCMPLASRGSRGQGFTPSHPKGARPCPQGASHLVKVSLPDFLNYYVQEKFSRASWVLFMGEVKREGGAGERGDGLQYSLHQSDQPYPIPALEHRSGPNHTTRHGDFKLSLLSNIVNGGYSTFQRRLA